jgi:glyoxylase-like metal-dependent hydrolase (beta-lactamase superfamily II)
MAIWIPWAHILVCGDYLSPVEIPMISEGGSVEAYRATLERLRPLVEAAEAVVPGHGAPLDQERSARLLQEDVAYLDALEQRGPDAPLPPGRRSQTQRAIHVRNAQSP